MRTVLIVLLLSVPLPGCSAATQERVSVGIGTASNVANRVCEVLNAAAVWTRLPSATDDGVFQIVKSSE